MVEEEKKEIPPKETIKNKNNFLWIAIVLLVVALVIVFGTMFFMKDNRAQIGVQKPVAEYIVKEKMYQLKDGSYLRLGFTIVVDADKIAIVENVLETISPGRLPDSIHMLLGNKSREDLISGSHKREEFARELKNALDDDVFNGYNLNKNPEEKIKVHNVFISDYVTQSG
jgi:flagellar basal body-associated protein FliL